MTHYFKRAAAVAAALTAIVLGSLSVTTASAGAASDSLVNRPHMCVTDDGYGRWNYCGQGH